MVISAKINEWNETIHTALMINCGFISTKAPRNKNNGIRAQPFAQPIDDLIVFAKPKSQFECPINNANNRNRPPITHNQTMAGIAENCSLPLTYQRNKTTANIIQPNTEPII